MDLFFNFFQNQKDRKKMGKNSKCHVIDERSQGKQRINQSKTFATKIKYFG